MPNVLIGFVVAVVVCPNVNPIKHVKIVAIAMAGKIILIAFLDTNNSFFMVCTDPNQNDITVAYVFYSTKGLDQGRLIVNECLAPNCLKCGDDICY
jgi:hypothetical protein